VVKPQQLGTVNNGVPTVLDLLTYGDPVGAQNHASLMAQMTTVQTGKSPPPRFFVSVYSSNAMTTVRRHPLPRVLFVQYKYERDAVTAVWSQGSVAALNIEPR
jgi:hypothetical protein